MSDYPRMMYHKDGRSQPVLNEDQELEMDSEWSREPSEVHRLMRSGDSASHVQPVHQSGHDDLIERLIARMREEFFGDSEAPVKRGPGRPPGTRNVSQDRGATRNLEPSKE